MVNQTLFCDSEKPHILVVDDDDRIRSLLSRYLREHNYVVATAENAEEAEEILKLCSFDGLIVDVMMPGKGGYEFTMNLRQSRALNTIPILLLTALGETDDRIKGLEHGADDYLPKPFEPKELLLRLKSILRRHKTIDRQISSIEFGHWVYDFDQLLLKRKGQGTQEEEEIIVYLTSVEGKLLESLSRQAGKILSREELARLCGLDGNERTVDVQITRLRKKIEDDSRYPRYIQTVRGQGYILKV